MNALFPTIYKGLGVAAVVAFLVGAITTSKTSLGAYIAGYSVLTLAILMVLIAMIGNLLRPTSSASPPSSWSTVLSILSTSGPILLLLAVIGFVLSQLVVYQDRIVQGHVASGYSSFSTLVTILIMLQLYLLYSNVRIDPVTKTEVVGQMSSLTRNIVYFIGVVSAICSVTLYTILKYYSTDGFEGMYASVAPFG